MLRMQCYLRRRGLLGRGLSSSDNDEDGYDPEAELAASAVSGREPPAGPQWLRGLLPLVPSELSFEKPPAEKHGNRQTCSPQ